MNVTSRLCTSTALVCGLTLALYTAAAAQKPAQAPKSHRAGNPSGMAPTPKPHDSFKGIAAKLGVAPVLLNLPLDGSTKVILDAVVPAGTYTGLRAKLEAVEGDDDGASAFLTAHPEFQGVSVKVGGVFTDAGGVDHPFTFTSGVEAEIAVDFPAPVTVDASTSNLTIDVNVGSWFTDASGAVIDPTNAANQAAIEQAIRASLSAFEDDNHDGSDDHEMSGAH